MENENLELFEDLLDENIPRDLAAAYKKIGNSGRSTRYEITDHPDSQHDELAGLQLNRRTAIYDYGKSNYEKLTKDEAKAYIKQDINNISNLRMLYKGDLVEAEPKHKGNSIYCVYRNSTQPVEYNGKYYKNIGYITNPNTLIDVVDTIYKTDEYDHKISPEEAEERRNRNKFVATGSIKSGNGYDPHSPHDNFMDNAQWHPTNLDTGDHNVKNRYSIKNFEFNNLDQDAERGTPSVHRRNVVLGDYYDEYARAEMNRKKLYDKYTSVRKALKKLEADKDEYDEEEYNELKQKWTTKQADVLRFYNIAAKEAKDLKSKLGDQISENQVRVNLKLKNYTKALQVATDKIHQIEDNIQALMNRQINDPENFYNDYARGLRRIKEVSDMIETDKERLEQIRQGTYMGDLSVDQAEDRLNYNIARLQTKYDELDQFGAEELNVHLREIKDLEQELEDANKQYLDSIASVRPKFVAQRQANKEANTKQMSDELANLLDFE